MGTYITASVFRYDPEKDLEPHHQEYRVDTSTEMSVLVLLDLIQKNIDPTLSFRSYCCGLQMCRSCLMKINGKKNFACITTVRPGDKIVVEPLSFPLRHIKDLVVTLSDEQTEE
ncbi:MAG TPA: 2Fe-2S iron-sulfur cluster-binding protein [Syntrophorhabdaceae bacterium]|nr:2Fe-2S iron-sulfur cluster-binding protein [Syntrophorhabdaceae bacterium]